MTFRVIDKKTGKEPTYRVIHNIAKKSGLMTCDIDQFFLGEDGQIILADDCGNIAYVDIARFYAEMVGDEDAENKNEKALKAAKTIKEYCQSMPNDCNGCMFLATRYKYPTEWLTCACKLRDTLPEEWEIEKEGEQDGCY